MQERMIVIRNKDCGLSFEVNENHKLPDVCPDAKVCHRACRRDAFEVIGIIQRVRREGGDKDDKKDIARR